MKNLEFHNEGIGSSYNKSVAKRAIYAKFTSPLLLKTKIL